MAVSLETKLWNSSRHLRKTKGKNMMNPHYDPKEKLIVLWRKPV